MKFQSFKLSNIVFILFIFILFSNTVSFIYLFVQNEKSLSKLSKANEISVTFNKALTSLFEIDIATSTLSSPINDIFINFNFKNEKTRLIGAKTKVSQSMKDLKDHLSKNKSLGDELITSDLELIQNSSDSIIENTEFVFALLKKGHLSAATKKMALVDSCYSQIRRTLIDIRKRWRSNLVNISKENSITMYSMASLSTKVLLINVLFCMALFVAALFGYIQSRQSNNISKFYRMALDQSSIVAAMNTRGEITYANERLCKISGFSIDELIGKDHRILNSKYHSENYFNDVWKTISNGDIWRGETKNIRKDGGFYWVDTTIVPMKNIAGIITQYVAIQHDITKLKEVEENLIAAKEGAEKANQIKSEFLANMSHEIRTPMNAVIGVSDLLSESPLNEEQRRYLNIFQKAGEHLLSLINDIFDFSKIESRTLKIESENFKLRKVLDTVLSLCQEKASSKKIDISYFIDSDVSEYYLGDHLRIHQVLMNLVSNAIKFTERGSVSIQVSKNLKKERVGNILISVSDTGIGISPQKQTKLFKAFTQADASTTKKYGGTGLGLAISKRLVEMMGGELWLTSAVDIGSTFFLTLTCESSTQQTPTSCPLVEIASDNKKPLDILLADDSEDNRELAKAFLKDSHHKIIEAENGFVAVSKFKKHKFDIILMDMQMPIMDGFSATKEIRSLEANTSSVQTPIIALTAYALDGEVKRCLAAGCDLHLSKPLRKKTLIKALETFSSPHARKVA